MPSPHESPKEDSQSDQHFAQDAGRVVLDGAVAKGAEFDLPDIPDHILSPEEANQWGKDNNYGNNRRGTLRNENSFLYIKWCHAVDKVEDVEPALAAARYLTEKGILHPATKWGVFKKPEEGAGYQLFAVSPKLDAWELTAEVIESEHSKRLQRPITDDKSALWEWCRRIAPDYTPTADMNEQAMLRNITEEPLLNLLNVYEASHPENWGWDKNGTMYPVDVEVINLATSLPVIREWYEASRAESTEQ